MVTVSSAPRGSPAIPEPPIWSGWQNAVINGVYPLHELLHGGQHSAVFLTDRPGQPGTHAALKIVPIERVTLAQLAHWQVVKGLSHPHLLKLFAAGLCHLGGRQFLFVVMEHAQQTLGGVLQQRALTADEVRELLPPTLDALAFLHGQGLVLGHLQPSNVLVVDDTLKLATDNVRPAGAPRVSDLEPCAYDPPEAVRAPFSPAEDIWGLGVTVLEALTNRLPEIDERLPAARLPETVPEEFAATLQQCLRLDPTARPSAARLAAPEAIAPEAIAPATIEPAAAAPVADAGSPPEVAPLPEVRAPRRSVAAFVTGVVLILVATVWVDLRLFHGGFASASRAVPATTATAAARSPAPSGARPAAVSQPTVAPPRTVAARKSGVLHAQLPDVARSSLRTIRGHVKVSVLAVVDRSGVVTAAHLESAGPSRYFAARATQAARKWRFAPDESGSREWLLHFEFSRTGITGAATPKR